MLNKLIVVPSDPLDAYIAKGTASWLERYYNPGKAFKEVYCLSPRETKEYEAFGMKVIGADGKKFKALLKEIQPDVVRGYGGYWASDFITENRVDNIPVVVSVHDTNPRLMHKSILDADTVFCMSKVIKEKILEMGGEESRLKLFSNRVDTNIFYPIKDQTEIDKIRTQFPKGKMLLHVGRKVTQKNIETVIKALKYLPEDYFTVFVGRGEVEPYSKLAQELSVESRCFWIQSIENSEMPNWYSACDCMCTPSLWEGFGVVFIEAAACGASIVTSDIAPMNEYFIHKENAYMVKEYTNPKALAKSIQEVCTDSELRNKFSVNALKVGEKFEVKKVEALEVELYKEVVNSFHKKDYVCLTGEEWNDVLINEKTKEGILKRIQNKEVSKWGEQIFLNTGSGDKLIEIGSGTGEISLGLALDGRKVTLLDISKNSLEFAKNLALELKTEVDIVCADVTEKLPFKDNEFDCVWQSGLLEHFSFEERAAMLTEFARISKDKVISMVPNSSCLAYRLGKAQQEKEGTWRYGIEIPLNTLRDEYEKAGLKVVKEYSVGVQHALNFLKQGSEERKLFEEMIKQIPTDDNYNQGYLLVTIGTKIL